jgi:hypothetical protein
MNILHEVSFHEVLKRWAIGEIESDFFRRSGFNKEEFLSYLKHDDKRGIIPLLCYRRFLITSSLQNRKWFLGVLPINKVEFSSFKTMKPDWEKLSKNTYNFCVAAENPDTINSRIRGIINNMYGNVEWMGITFIAQSEKGPYTIVEGYGRLVALYHYYIKNNNVFPNNGIEVMVGVSSTKWEMES